MQIIYENNLIFRSYLPDKLVIIVISIKDLLKCLSVKRWKIIIKVFRRFVK